MAKEISFFNEKLEAHLESVAEKIDKEYGVQVRFVKIMGKRWSYIAGRNDSADFPIFPQRIEITDRYGLVSNGWQRIPVTESERIISSLQQTFMLHG